LSDGRDVERNLTEHEMAKKIKILKNYIAEQRVSIKQMASVRILSVSKKNKDPFMAETSNAEK
jgi:hypothetical protein